MPEASGLPNDSHVIVVGKFELDPPLNPELEQTTHWSAIGDKGILKKIYYSTDSKPVELDTDISFSQWQKQIEVMWNQLFFVKAEAKKTYLNGGIIYLDMVEQSRIWFPGGLYFDPPPGAKAIYIGTIHFTRNDFWVIKRVQVIDDYSEANKVFKKQFASEATLKKVLLQKVN